MSRPSTVPEIATLPLIIISENVSITTLYVLPSPVSNCKVLLALYPVTGKKFLKIKYGLEEMPEDMKAKTMDDVKKEQDLITKALAGELSASSTNSNGSMQEMEVFVDGESFTVSIPNTKATTRSVWKKKEAKESKEVVKEGACTAPIPGMIVEFKKKNGDEVKAGEIVVVLEAMKMMNNFEANKDGVISGIKFDSGDTVVKGDILVTIE